MLSLRPMDVLTNVLETTQVRGVVLADFRQAAPWGLELGAHDVAGFHLVTEGACFLRMSRRAPLHLMQGDLVLIPGGAAHSISDSPTSAVVPLEQYIASNRRSTTSPGGTRMVCGAYRFEGTGPNPLLALLPSVLHVPANIIQHDDALRSTLHLLVGELDRRAPGSEALVDRLFDALFIYVVRRWLEGLPEGQGGWLGALRDAQVGRALSAIHKEPQKRWTVELLADAVGLSRAAFARRFTALVGLPPLAYLTRWRLDLAARRLRTSDLSLAAIAAEVGYESEFAFSRAFKRALGTPPGRFRETAKATPG